MIGAIENKKQEYNAIPVQYCAHCLSLNLVVLDQSIDYCAECGCTDTNESHIEEWESLYETRYGKKLLK